MRLFVAIQLSDEMKKAYQVRLPKVEMTVRKVSLMKSEMKNGKTVYREM